MTDYSSFRQRLDAVLRTLDVQQVSKFLIAENQWDVGTPANPEFAMWMMIAGSPTLRDLHDTARIWLLSHGFEDEAHAVLDRDRAGQGGTKGGGNRSRPQGAKPRQQGGGSSQKRPGGGQGGNRPRGGNAPGNQGGNSRGGGQNRDSRGDRPR